MTENSNAATAVLVTSVDQAGDHRDVIEAVSAALGGARLVHTVGGPGGATADEVVGNPDHALGQIVTAV